MSLKASLLQTAFILAALSLLPASARSEERAFSHDDWATVLRKVVDELGLVDYQALARDRVALDRYLEQIRTTSPANRPELFPTSDHQLAYYINAYNALVMGKVLEKGPDRKTVWGVTGSGYSFFVGRKVVLGGRRMSLRALEDDFIRSEFKDPRIHAAINCASISCPPLPREPFLAATLSTQLDAAMQGFVTEERNVRLEGDTVLLSKIFEWFKDDFLAFEKEGGADDPSVLGYINRYLPAGRQLDLDAAVTTLEYDKGLNRQP